MSLEQQCRRKPDIEGIPVRLRNGEDWLIPKGEIVPIFEKEDGQWMLKRMGIGGPFKKRFNRIHELLEKAAEKDSLPKDMFEEMTTLGLEIPAMALDQNYDLTSDQIGDLIDPTDQKMLTNIMAALRGVDRSEKDVGENQDDEQLSDDEKKKE